MTETEHLIRQAAREIGITLDIARDSKLHCVFQPRRTSRLRFEVFPTDSFETYSQSLNNLLLDPS